MHLPHLGMLFRTLTDKVAVIYVIRNICPKDLHRVLLFVTDVDFVWNGNAYRLIVTRKFPVANDER